MSLAVKKYSNALFEICLEENCLEEVHEQFAALHDEIQSNKDFQKILQTKMLSASEKKDLFEKALEGGNQYFLNFLLMLVDRDRTEELDEMFIAFDESYKDHKNILEATAVTAIELNAEELENLKGMLSAKYNKTVELQNKVDESILGGMILYVGNTMLDASVKTKMNGLKDHLKEIKIS